MFVKFLMCFLTFWSIVLICGFVFGFKYISKKRDESVKYLYLKHNKHKIDL